MAIQVDEDYEVRQWTKPSPLPLVTVLAATLLLSAGRNEDYVYPATTPAIVSEDTRTAPIVPTWYKDRWDASRQQQIWSWAAGNEDYVYPATTPAIASEDTRTAPIVPSWYKDPRDPSRQQQIWAWAAGNEDYILAPLPYGNSQPWLTAPIGTPDSNVTLFWWNDEAVPQAAQHPFEDDSWDVTLPWPVQFRPAQFSWNDEVVPQATPFVFEEDSWVASIIWPQQAAPRPAQDDSDYVYPATTPAILVEDIWDVASPWAQQVSQQQFNWNDEVVPQAVSLVFEEDSWTVQAVWQQQWHGTLFNDDSDVPTLYGVQSDETGWLAPAQWVVQPQVPQFSYNDDIVPVAGDDVGWTAPTLWTQPSWRGSGLVVVEDDFVAPSGAPVLPFGNSQPWLVSTGWDTQSIVTVWQANDEIVQQAPPVVDDDWGFAPAATKVQWFSLAQACPWVDEDVPTLVAPPTPFSITVVCQSPSNLLYPEARAFVYVQSLPPLTDFIYIPAPACLRKQNRYLIFDWTQYANGYPTAIGGGVYDGVSPLFLAIPNPAVPLQNLTVNQITHLPMPVPAGQYVICVTATADGDPRQ